MRSCGFPWRGKGAKHVFSGEGTPVQSGTMSDSSPEGGQGLEVSPGGDFLGI